MNTDQATFVLIPRARNTDPSTSVDAARSVKDLRPKLKAVLDVLKRCGPVTHEELVEIYKNHHPSYFLPKQSDSGIRSRCHELLGLGLVRDTGERRKMSTGRFAIVWGVK